MANAQEPYRYEVDGDDHIRSVSDAWLRFAAENAAPAITRENVLGRELWDFIEGERTRDFYRTILRRARQSDAPVIVPFRCDSPAVRRDMRLVISPLLSDALQLDGVLVRMEPRLYLGILDSGVRRSERQLPMCSCCKRVLVDDDWLEPEDAVARLRLLDEEDYPTLQQLVCDRCAVVLGDSVSENPGA